MLSEKTGTSRMNKVRNSSATGPSVAVPLMASTVSLFNLIDFLNWEIVPISPGAQKI